MNRQPGVAVPLLVATLVVPLIGCGSETFQSRWRDREVTIDARTRDWEGALTTLDDRGMDVGAINDGEHLYICLVLGTRDDQMQLIRLGATLWLDPEGGDERVLGIRYPLGVDPSRLAPPEPGERGGSLEDAWRDLDDELKLEVITRDGSIERLPIGDAEGIALRAGEERAQLVYEVRIPLSPDAGRYALDVTKGTIGVGIETPEMPLPETRPAGGPGFGGRRGAAIGDPPKGRPGGLRPKPLELRARIRLAEPPDSR